MKNLLLSSFIAFAFSACTLGHYGSLKKIPTDTNVPKSIFGQNFNSFLFNADILVYGKTFSGLMITKQMSPQDYRVIFTTELGLKLFDFEFKDTSFTLHYCVPQFNRPKLLNTIQKDIQIVLMNDMEKQTFESYADSKDEYLIQKTKSNEMYNYYFIEKESKQLTKIEHSKKRVKKTIFTYWNYVNGFPSTILIKHCDIKLMIELNTLKR